ncbi:MAG: HEAT repeat domain-containing protein [Anaerolineae bacterium]|nr:HEAT repeat domain-containing protein [Anaerolineae bacterium]
MDDLQRAQRLLNSPIDADQRKAIQMLAKSGDRRALAILRQAYDSAESAEIKQMALKGGAYLKQNLRDEVLAPVEDPITFGLPDDKYNLDEPDTSAIEPEIEADWMMSAVKGESKSEAKARKKGTPKSREGNTTEVMAAIALFVMCFVYIFASFDAWVTLENLEIAPGVTVMDDIETAIPHDAPRPSFGVFAITSVLGGNLSPWYQFASAPQLDEINYYSKYLQAQPWATNIYAGSLDGVVGFAPILVTLFMVMMVVAIMTKSEIQWLRSGFAILFYGIGTLLFRLLPNRILWVLVMIGGFLQVATLVIFLFDILPRFSQAVIKMMELGSPVYQPYQLLGWGFFVSAGATIVIIIGAFIGLMSYDTKSVS